MAKSEQIIPASEGNVTHPSAVQSLHSHTIGLTSNCLVLMQLGDDWKH
jgi:hypothetical protein